MKFITLTLAFLATLTLAETLLANCDDFQIKRSSDFPAACAHFDGVDAASYRNWYDDNDISSRYTGSVYLPGSDPTQPENGAAIHWNIQGESLYLAVAVRASGWLGFGIAEAGGMLGADMVLFEAAKPNEIVDAYTTDARSPLTDDCPSDWELLRASVDEDSGFIMIELKRLLDTKDPQDRKIFNDASTLVSPHRVIAAWGDSPVVGYHGLNRTRGAIRFYGTGDDRATFDTTMDLQADGSFIVASIDHEIAADETEYFHTCFSRNDLIEQGVLNTTDLLNIVGFEPIVQEGHEAYVHHYIVTGSQQPDCSENVTFMEIVYVWAPGEGPVSLPDSLGSPLFGKDGFQAFNIEVHYNNPGLNIGIFDNSGVRIFWTSDPRDEQIGIMSVGDPNVSLFGQNVGDGLSYHSFECPGSCSSLVAQPVTVVREYLHMHATGTRMVNEQIRDGKTIRGAVVDYWEFDQNGNIAIQQNPFEIQPGDGFKTSCFYNGGGRVFGIGSADEMCIAFLYYFPRATINVEDSDLEMPWMCGYQLGFPPCDTTYENKSLSDMDDVGRLFGVSTRGTCQTDGETTTDPDDEYDMSAAPPLGIYLLGLAAFVAVLF